MLDCICAICIAVCISLFIKKIGLPALLSDISYNIYILNSVILGLLSAKYGFVDKLVERLSTYMKIIMAFLISVAVQISFDFFPPLRQFLYLEAINTLISISAVSAFLSLLSSTWINNKLMFIGKHSMNIWFLHGIFFVHSCYFQKYAFFPRYAIFVLCWVILLMLPLSFVISNIQKSVLTTINKMIK